MSWSMGLAAIIGGYLVLAVVVMAIHDMNSTDSEWDSTADFKRRVERRGARQRWGARDE